MIDKVEYWAEEIVIRFLCVLDAFTKPYGLCPPQCRDGHTYKWPCRGRIRKPKVSKVGAYYEEDPYDPLWDETRIYDDPTEHWSG